MKWKLLVAAAIVLGACVALVQIVLNPGKEVAPEVEPKTEDVQTEDVAKKEEGTKDQDTEEGTEEHPFTVEPRSDSVEVEDEGPGTDVVPPAAKPATPSGSTSFDVEGYLKENFPIDHMSYSVESWKDKNTGKTELLIVMTADTAKLDQDIQASFDKGDAFVSNDHTIHMQKMAETIINSVPKADKGYHVEQVVWQKKGDKAKRVRLSHDLERSTMQ